MKSPSPHQFRMARLQVFNWGTFSQLHEIPIAERGFLFVGHSGSGKSTLLDAFSALLVPPKWIAFNAAAAEADRTGRDRNLPSYIRGAWAEQKDGDSGEIAMRYLRTGTTWSALAVTFHNGIGHTVVLVQLFWLRGTTNANTDVRRHFLIFERPFELKELKGFDLDIRKLKQAFPEAFERSEFRPYSERFRRLLGIESEMALRLLHKTQSAKNLGDLNTLLRDFMLDRPDTFEVADRLVNEFSELNTAHQAVVTAREQVETLSPARESYQHLTQCQEQKQHLETLQLGVDGYRESQRIVLLEERINALIMEGEGLQGETRRKEAIVDNHKATMRDLEQQHRDLGGDYIEQWEREKRALGEQTSERLRRRGQAEQACSQLGLVLPDNPQGFAERTSEARREVERWNQESEATRARQFDLADQRKQAERECAAAVREVEALRRRPSNIPAEMQDLRGDIARALELPESALPFAGELIEVNAQDAPWRGAIERVLRGFALSVLVEERHYIALSNHVNSVKLGHRRLVYFRMGRPERSPANPLAPSSMIRKLNLKAGDHVTWLEAELKQRFDYVCVESLQAFRSTERALTREGQIRHGKTRHEKDDRRDIDDPRHWVLGFDNKEKLAGFTRQAHEAVERIGEVTRELQALDNQERKRHQRAMACQTLANMQWQEIDIAPLLDRTRIIVQNIRSARIGSPALQKISEQIAQQEERVKAAEKELQEVGVRKHGIEEKVTDNQRRLAEVQALSSPITGHLRDTLARRFAELNKPLTLDNLDELSRRVERLLTTETKALDERRHAFSKFVEERFADYKRRWPMEAGDMDTTLASAPDYLARLRRLETDGLPAHEQRFFELLQTQSNQNLAALSTHLRQAQKAITERMELVNESLSHAEFNRNTFLKIDVNDRQTQDVHAFKQEIEQALRHAWTDDRENAEARFKVLRAIVERLANQEPEHQRWRESVLDVRQHVEFIAREVDADGCDLEIYRSGAGKSGGQRQKLATTCLAAALRYQLGSDDQRIPIYAPVVLDEAFEKADNEFTTLAMNVFVEFGFQMIVATPLKSVMTLEPFIGGACFVEIRERRHSAVLMIEYDDEHRRLKLPEQYLRQDIEVETP